MKHIIKFGCLLGLIISNSAFSIENPVQGLYFGLLGQISHAPNSTLNFTLDQNYTGTINLGPVGGGIGTSLGYRINSFRVEAEFLFNINNYGSLKLGPCTLISPKVFGPEGTCPAFIENNKLGFNGSTMGFYGLINGFYDFFPSDPNSDLVPFIGLGLGGVLLRNHALFETNEQDASLGVPVISFTQDTNNTGLALQGMLGLNYFIDDLTTIGIDFRYLSAISFNKNNNSNSQFGIYTLNLTGTFALDVGSD